MVPKADCGHPRHATLDSLGCGKTIWKFLFVFFFFKEKKELELHLIYNLTLEFRALIWKVGQTITPVGDGVMGILPHGALGSGD